MFGMLGILQPWNSPLKLYMDELVMETQIRGEPLPVEKPHNDPNNFAAGEENFL